jgi:predicted dienelactone hydrolase
MQKRRLVFVVFGLLVLLVLARSVGRAPGQILRQRIQQKIQEKEANAQVTPRGPANCDGAPNLGFTLVTFSTGLRAAVWYPALDGESRYQYASGLVTALAPDAPAAGCAAYPMIVFSHGFGGCGTQSLFLTESLARAGYIVVAPDHKDAGCKVDQPREGMRFERAEEPFRQPQKWDDSTYRDRQRDIRTVLNEIPRQPAFGKQIDADRIGMAGHSLGGYTAAAMAGAWPSWRDGRIKAALLLSPYVEPFLFKETLGGIRVPVMYQGGDRDFGITPQVRKPGGAYDQTRPPKYFAEFHSTGHLGWTILICQPYGAVPACMDQSARAREIDEYGVAFFNHYLKGRPEGILERPNPLLADYRHQD